MLINLSQNSLKGIIRGLVVVFVLFANAGAAQEGGMGKGAAQAATERPVSISSGWQDSAFIIGSTYKIKAFPAKSLSGT